MKKATKQPDRGPLRRGGGAARGTSKAADLCVPYDEAAEAALLGSMIVDPRCIADVLARGVTADDFYLPEHREIFEAVYAVYRRTGSTDGMDGLLVREELERRNALQKIGGTVYLQRIMDSVPSSANSQYYSAIVQDRHARRMMWVAGEKLLQGASDLGKDVNEELAGARIDLSEIASHKNDTPPDIKIVQAAAWLTIEPPVADQILGDMFDTGDKVAIIGSSKLRKSFFLGQTCLSIASGRDFLGWPTPKPRRVFLVQLEIQAHHFHRRVRRMAAALELTPESLEDRFQIINGRGLALAGKDGIETIKHAVLPFAPDLICFDPLYKISSGSENAAEDMKVVLSLFDELTEQTGAAVLYVHHDAKGFSGDRDIRDRGSGSGVLGRDYDACFTLTRHAIEDNAVVVETLLRNYRAQEPCTIAWTDASGDGGYCFELRPDLAPTKKTSTTARTHDVPMASCHQLALDILQYGPLPIAQFKEKLREKTGIGQKRIDGYVRWALTRAEDPLDVFERYGKGKHVKMIGTPDQIRRLKEHP